MAAKPRMNKIVTPERIELNTENEKVILKWKSPSYETRSARQRRELNAGKGGRRTGVPTCQDADERIRTKNFSQKNGLKILEEDVDELDVEKAALQESLTARESEVNKLTKRTHDQASKIDELLVEKFKAADDMRFLKSKSSDLTEQIKKLKEEKEAGEIKLKTLENEIENFQRTGDTLKNEQEERMKQSEMYEKSITEYKQVNEVMKNKVERLSTVNEKYSTDIAELRSNLETVREDLCTATKKKKELEEKCQQYENELKIRIQESLNIMDGLDQMKVISNKQSEQIDELVKNSEQQNDILQTKQMEIENLIMKSDTLTSEIEEDKIKRIHIQLEIEQKDLKIEEQKEEICILTNDMEKKDDIIRNFSDDNKTLREKIGEASSLVEEVLKKSDGFKNMLEKEKQKNDFMRFDDERNELKSKCDILAKQVNEEETLRRQAEEEAERARQKIEELVLDLENALKQTIEREAASKGLEKDNKTLRDHCPQGEAFIEEKKAEIEKLKNDIHIERGEKEDKILNLRKNIKELNNRDEANSILMKSLVDDNERYSTLLTQESDNFTRLKIEFETYKIDRDLECDRHLGEIKTLKEELQNDCDDTVKKLTGEKMQQDIFEKIELIEKLKQENKNFKDAFDQHNMEMRELKTRLGDSISLLGEKQTECDDYQDKVYLKSETCKQMMTTIENLRVKVKDLEIAMIEKESRIGELKKNLDDCVDKHRVELEHLKINHSRRVQKLHDNADISQKKSKEEINELLNNFSELELELSFCQDELTLKDAEVDKLSRQLEIAASNYLRKEQKLLRDLETLNEQNEIILQNEIRKYKTENEEKLLEMAKNNTAGMEKMRSEFQEQMESAEQQSEEKLREMRGTLTEKKVSTTSACRDEAQNKLNMREETNATMLKRYDDNVKLMTMKIESKTNINDKLNRRIGTQQKLIDYLMKSLEQERSKQGNTSGDFILALNSIRQQIDIDNMHSDTNRARFSSPHSSALSNTSEVFLTPNEKLDIIEGFVPPVTSSPEEKHQLSKFLPLSCKGDSVQKYLDSMNQNYLSQSLPSTTTTPDLGYVSPIRETNTFSFYFDDQMRTISSAFDRIEMIGGHDNKANEQLSLEIWKQKIHIRLRALEDEMSELESLSNSSRSFKSIDSTKTPPVKDTPSRRVTFYPSNEEIRELINNVNQKYERLNKTF